MGKREKMREVMNKERMNREKTKERREVMMVRMLTAQIQLAELFAQPTYSVFSPNTIPITTISSHRMSGLTFTSTQHSMDQLQSNSLLPGSTQLLAAINSSHMPN